MDIEKQIEDLCLEQAQQEAIITRVQHANICGASAQDRASLASQREMASAKLYAINSQLREMRNKLAEDYKARNKGALHGKDYNGQNTVQNNTG